jgi:hypothetical protein
MLACQVGIGTVLLASLFTKESRALFATADAPSVPRRMLELVELAHAPAVLLIVYLLLDASVYLAIGILILVAATGWALKRVGGGGQCNCYGALTRGSRRREWRLHIALGGMSLIVLGLRAGYGRPLELLPAIWLFPASLAIGAAIAYVFGRAPSEAASSAERPFVPDDLVGTLRDGTPIRLATIASTCPMMVFIALSSNCSSCQALKPILFPITRLFSDQLRVVYLVDDFVQFEALDPADVLLKGEATYIARLGGTQFPFAAVLHSGSLARIGDVAYGDAIGALLLRVLLVAVRIRGNTANRSEARSDKEPA